MSKFLAIFLVASVCCLASAESLGSQTDLVLDREQQVNIYIFLGGLRSDLIYPSVAVDMLLDNDYDRDSVKALLSQTKDVLEKVDDDLKAYLDKLSPGTRIQPQL